MAFLSSAFDYDAPDAAAHWDEAGKQLVGRIRLLLAVSALFAAVSEPSGHGRLNFYAIVILFCYALACAAVCIYAALNGRVPQRLMHRVDAGVFVAITAAGGQADADVFPLVFLFFAIVVASLRWGLEEGARVTIAAVILYCAAAVATVPGLTLLRLCLDAVVLLCFGHAIALLGEKNIQSMRRQALQYALSQVANPRFGIDRTMTAALECTRAFFKAESCIVLIEDRDTGAFSIRSVRQGSPLVVPAATIDGELARTMLPDPRAHAFLYRSIRRPWFGAAHTELGHNGGTGRWHHLDGRALRDLGELLEADSFISAPLMFGRGKGRIYVTARARHFVRSDATFLARITAHDLIAVDRIDLLDRIASEAATLERKKIALDLHDTAIQSYIGLQLGLAALHKQAASSNPLARDLDKLVAMAAGAVMQLRDYANGACGAPEAEEPIFLTALRRHATQVMVSYGVDVRIDIDGPMAFGDRLSAEVLQILREGVSNICRHTLAKRAIVSLHCGAGLLRIEINNEHGGKQPPPFRPRSISQRAAALGGAAFVRQGRFNDTIVCVEIPL